MSTMMKNVALWSVWVTKKQLGNNFLGTMLTVPIRPKSCASAGTRLALKHETAFRISIAFYENTLNTLPEATIFRLIRHNFTATQTVHTTDRFRYHKHITTALHRGIRQWRTFKSDPIFFFFYKHSKYYETFLY